MADYPLGGIVIQTNDTGRVELFGAVFGPTGFDGVETSITVYPAGTILARNTVGSSNTVGTMSPFIVGGSFGLDDPIAILADQLTTDAVPTQQEIEVIMTGQVRLARITVWAGGTPITPLLPAQDALKANGILALDSFNLSKLDNGAP